MSVFYSFLKTFSSSFKLFNFRAEIADYNQRNPRREYSLNDRKCWKCGKPSNKIDEIFFCKCGVVQSVRDVSYFEIIGIKDSFDVDTTDLSNKYKELQKLLHPDKHTLKSETEKQLAEEQSSLVNKAYTTLIKPLNRALYMLERAGQPLEEENSSVDQEFLVEIMEINEEIAEADSTEALKPIDNVNKKRLDENIKSLSTAFKNGDITMAKNLVIRLKYFTNIDEKIKEIHRGQY